MDLLSLRSISSNRDLCSVDHAVNRHVKAIKQPSYNTPCLLAN
jgi:hypothetical protein